MRRGGLISPIIPWPYLADHWVALFRRSAGGLISAITWWLYSTDSSTATNLFQTDHVLQRLTVYFLSAAWAKKP
jgi:hypothetical protein